MVLQQNISLSEGIVWGASRVQFCYLYMAVQVLLFLVLYTKMFGPTLSAVLVPLERGSCILPPQIPLVMRRNA